MLERITPQLDPYVTPHNLNGPRMRLGAVWFFALLLGVALGVGYLALLFGLVAGGAALQAAKTWSTRGVAIANVVAGLGALLLPVAAWIGVRPLGAVLLIFAIGSLAIDERLQLDRSVLDPEHRAAALSRAAATLRCGLIPGLAAASVVRVYEADVMFYVLLLSVACIYDAGDFMCGAGYDNRIVGPIAGAIGVVAVASSLSLITPSPLDGTAAVVMGFVMAVCAPAGQLLGSAVLPTARAFAPILRRLDSWLVCAPMFLFGVWIVGG